MHSCDCGKYFQKLNLQADKHTNHTLAFTTRPNCTRQGPLRPGPGYDRNTRCCWSAIIPSTSPNFECIAIASQILYIYLSQNIRRFMVYSQRENIFDGNPFNRKFLNGVNGSVTRIWSSYSSAFRFSKSV